MEPLANWSSQSPSAPTARRPGGYRLGRLSLRRAARATGAVEQAARLLSVGYPLGRWRGARAGTVRGAWRSGGPPELRAP